VALRRRVAHRLPVLAAAMPGMAARFALDETAASVAEVPPYP
jgi:hypothetical protein